MKLYAQIILVFCVLISGAIYFLLNTAIDELKPAIRQSSEELLVDTVNLLAEMIRTDITNQGIDTLAFSKNVNAFLSRELNAKIYAIEKKQSQLRIYLTDKNGTLIYHSSPLFQKELGKDYSQWNDVYLTLLGKYGARSSEDIEGDKSTSFMYVAAPIYHNDDIIGVISVGKPRTDLLPFIDSTIKNLYKYSAIISLITLVLGILFAFVITHSVRKLTRYVKQMKDDRPAKQPKLIDNELQQLGDAITEMKQALDGKAYVEQYTQSLTHELKSPIAAVSGASELLSQQLSETDFSRLRDNIIIESQRLDNLVSRMLQLTQVESLAIVESPTRFLMDELIEEIKYSKALLLEKHGLALITPTPTGIELSGDRLLVFQSLDNLVQNAVEFSEDNSAIEIQITNDEDSISIIVLDAGTGIPDYAMDKITDRFYSLPRPNNALKSTGLGLNFVQKIMQLHHGKLTIKNRQPSGVIATLIFPQN